MYLNTKSAYSIYYAHVDTVHFIFVFNFDLIVRRFVREETTSFVNYSFVVLFVYNIVGRKMKIYSICKLSQYCALMRYRSRIIYRYVTKLISYYNFIIQDIGHYQCGQP